MNQQFFLWGLEEKRTFFLGSAINRLEREGERER